MRPNFRCDPGCTYGAGSNEPCSLRDMRAEYLKREGYDTQILEFIDMEHTPKNILIRAIYTGNKGKNTEAIRTCEEMLHIDPMLGRLLDQQNEEGEKGV